MSTSVLSSGCSPLRLAANRRNALKSTGPRTVAGKRRAALNGIERSLCSEELEKQLQARGRDPREFRDLHRDLMAIFNPKAKATFAAVEMLARLWWEKARRIQAWVGAGAPSTDDLDAKLEAVMHVLVLTKQMRHEWWRTELTAVLGRRPLPTPAAVRSAVEARLSLFGAKPGRRKYPRIPSRGALIRDFLEYRHTVAETAKANARFNQEPAVRDEEERGEPNRTH